MSCTELSGAFHFVDKKLTFIEHIFIEKKTLLSTY